MNRFEKESMRRRRSPATLWTVALVLVALAVAVVGLSTGAPKPFWTKAAVVLALLLLVLRQVKRRTKGRPSKAAQPDPQSRLNLQ